jgi:Na+-driven multidrug efflux pump
MTAGGFSNALSTLSGQAFGAKNYSKQWDGFMSAASIAVVIGIITSLVFILFPGALFSIFINDPESVSMGKDYLTILGYSQVFACIESAATGAFYGWGKTNIPALISISLTAIRIPLALFFIEIMKTNLTGIWWSIALSSIAKGIILAVLFIYMLKSFLKNQLSRVSYEY